jgi:hypothetical protein
VVRALRRRLLGGCDESVPRASVVLVVAVIGVTTTVTAARQAVSPAPQAASPFAGAGN